MRTILHVDMDAFFASVEVREHPEWRGKPVIVGSGPHERGVVSTCSYEARKFGVHSAMPSRTAYQHCPHAIFVRPHMELYSKVSEAAFEVFSHYSPFVEGVSIDEAFLDISGTLHLYGNDMAKLGEALRKEILDTCGVTCSVGIAPNRLLAKIGSEQNKPDGLTIMPFDEKAIAKFLAPRPLKILWGVGRKTAESLRPYGIATCGDVQRLATDSSMPAFLPQFLIDYAFGRDSSEVAWKDSEEKSVSREHTFRNDETNRAVIRQKLLELVTEVGQRFRSTKRWARTARIKIRDANFNTVLRQRPFEHPSRDDFAFRQAALDLFDGESVGSVRLIGFGVTNLQNTPDDGGPLLFKDAGDEKREKLEKLSETLDSLRAKGLL